MGAQIGPPLELSFSPKLLKNGMGACLGTWAGDALSQLITVGCTFYYSTAYIWRRDLVPLVAKATAQCPHHTTDIHQQKSNMRDNTLMTMLFLVCFLDLQHCLQNVSVYDHPIVFSIDLWKFVRTTPKGCALSLGVQDIVTIMFGFGCNEALQTLWLLSIQDIIGGEKGPLRSQVQTFFFASPCVYYYSSCVHLYYQIFHRNSVNVARVQQPFVPPIPIVPHRQNYEFKVI